MSEEGERFDAIVVGAGPAGSAAAYVMAKAGMEVVLLERGDYPGAKNVWGGVLFRDATAAVFPEFWADAPLERAVVDQRVWLLAKIPSPTAGLSRSHGQSHRITRLLPCGRDRPVLRQEG